MAEQKQNIYTCTSCGEKFVYDINMDNTEVLESIIPGKFRLIKEYDIAYKTEIKCPKCGKVYTVYDLKD
jgi:transcription initiation factor IIE alpha subunit